MIGAVTDIAMMYLKNKIFVKIGASRGWSKSVLVSTWYSIGVV